jgi:transposase-like protein
VKVAGSWRYVYRAVDEYGQVIDVYVSARRDATAARAFFDRALAAAGVAPVEVVTDQAAAYVGVLEQALPEAGHRTEQYLTHGRATQQRHDDRYDATGTPRAAPDAQAIAIAHNSRRHSDRTADLVAPHRSYRSG